MTNNQSTKGLSRIDGRLKVTGAARYSAEFTPAGMGYGVLVGSAITKGSIRSIETRAAERAPGVLSVITYLNCPKIAGYQVEPGKKEPEKGTYKLIYNNKILFNGQPIAIVVADTLERALYAASLVKAQYNADEHNTRLIDQKHTAFAPEGDGTSKRGEVDAWKTAPFKLQEEYIIPSEVHSPMELHAIVA